MKKCELCNSPAKLFCESDQASLCWECDARVHSANFLVTKHSRILLCHVCQSATAWHGSGPKFVPTISVCNHCICNSNESCSNQQNDDDDDEDGDRDDDDDDRGDDTENGEMGGDDGGGDEDKEENQVVPWISTPPPPVSSSSNSSASYTRFSNGEEGVSD